MFFEPWSLVLGSLLKGLIPDLCGSQSKKCTPPCTDLGSVHTVTVLRVLVKISGLSPNGWSFGNPCSKICFNVGSDLRVLYAILEWLARWNIRDIRPSNNLRNFYFLFYFSRHKLEISLNNAQAKKFHVKTRKRHGSRTIYYKKFCMDNGSRLFASK